MLRELSEVHSVSPDIARIIPVSSRPPTQDTITGRMYCPPGMYLDKTLGIYRCHDAHGTHPLPAATGVRGARPLAPTDDRTQWMNAWGLENG
jgi:hypothetical protein